MKKSIQEFIQQHLNDDVLTLILQAKKFPEIDMPLVVRQISGRQKFKKKVPFFFEHPDIIFPTQLSVEQASSEITAKYKSALISGDTFADMTGGFGVDFFFLSQRFKHGYYVERDEELCKLAIQNFKTLGIKSFDVIKKNAEDFVAEMPEVDLIYVDPHRRNSIGKKTVKISDCEPDVSVLAKNTHAKFRKMMIKLSPMLDIRQAIKDIPQTSEVHIIAVENECKEVLLLINGRCSDEVKGNNKEIVTIKTLNFLKNGNFQRFEYQLNDELVCESTYTVFPLQYLYEPNAAIMKSGAFKTIGEHYGLKKFHPNTHLYTDNTLKIDFPGRIFSIEVVTGNNKGDFQLLQQRFPKANITVRNYPMSVEEYKKKSRIKDGGEIYLFALKTNDNKLINIIAKKINLTSLD
jgi:16S rRNA G966 N2-methylase RsmD